MHTVASAWATEERAVDEAGHSGDPGTANGGTGGEPVNGWLPPNSPWSNAGAALDPEDDDDVPAWRRPSQEIRPFTRQQFPPERPSGDVTRRPPERQSGEINRFPGTTSGNVRVPGSTSGQVPPPRPEMPRPETSRPETSRPETSRPESPASPPPWSSGRARYADLLAHLSPNGHEPSLQPGPVPSAPPAATSDPFGPDPSRAASLRPGMLRPEAPRAPGFPPRPDTLEDQRRTSEMRAIDAPAPSSAPPYPYEGDLDDDPRDHLRPPVVQQRAAVPLTRSFPAVRPAAPGDRRLDWNEARHALEPNTPPGSHPPVESSAPTVERRPSGEIGPVRPSYDAPSYPRRFPHPDPAGPAPLPDSSTGYAPPAAYFGPSGRSTGDPGTGPSSILSRALPQRVPAEPDVPTVPEPPSVEPTAETPALARIATHLRRGDVLPADERQEGFDVNAILEAVREVEGVRDASLRSTPTGAHSLRLDLAEGADPAEVSRQVARLLQDRMGLDAAMQGGSAPPPPAPPPPAPSSPAPAARPPAPTTRPSAPSALSPAALSPAAPSALAPAASAPAASAPAALGPAALGPAALGPAASAPAAPGPAALPPAYPTQPTPSPTFPAQASPPALPGPPAPVRATASAPVVPLARSAPVSRAADPVSTPAVPVTRAASAPVSPTLPSPAAPPPPNRAAVAPVTPAAPVVPAARLPQSPQAGLASGTSAVADRPALDRPAAAGPAAAPDVAPTGGVDCGPPRPLPVGERPGPRVVIENVQVNTFGTEANVEVRLAIEGRTASGVATGPAVDGYLLRLCATATTHAVDELLSGSDHADGPARCYVEHAASVPFGAMQVAVVVLLLSCGNWVEQLAGSAVVTGDDRHAMVRATLAAVNRRLEALLS